MPFRIPRLDVTALTTGWNRTLLLGAGAFAGVVLTAAAIHLAKQSSGVLSAGALGFGPKRYRR
jgi:hypothetical protein